MKHLKSTYLVCNGMPAFSMDVIGENITKYLQAKSTINEHHLHKYTTLTVTDQRDSKASTHFKMNFIQIVNYQIVFDVIRYSLSILCYYQRRVTSPRTTLVASVTMLSN